MIKRWAIADSATKEVSGGIIQNDTAPVASGMVVLELSDSLRDEHPDNLQLDSAGTSIEKKPSATILAEKKAKREKEIGDELYTEAQRQLPMHVLLRAFTTLFGILASEGNITSSDSDTQALIDTLTTNISQLGFTPAQLNQTLLLQKSLLDRKGVASTAIDTIIADGTKTDDEKEKEIKKVKG